MKFKMWSNENGDDLATEVNQFLEEHPDIDIVDYKMTTSYYQRNYYKNDFVSVPQYQVGLFYKGLG